jgi:predicted nuclease of restriction endonuclease-like RecB superfamily
MRDAITSALRRVLGGRAERSRIARKLRATVLGHPALEPPDRAARIAAAAAALGIAGEDVESLLWADLARERPVVLPSARPDPRLLAAIANVDRIQREMRRARMIELRVWDNAHGLVRLAARCGLITQVTREPDGALLLRIAGPLALFHTTTVYGRALGALVPLLVDHPRFELDIHCDYASGPHTRRVVPPVLLPPFTSRLKPSPADRLAKDLALREHIVDRDPAPLTVGEQVLFPDLSIDFAGVRWFVEVVGFSTADYLADKLALYRAANAHVILCVDSKRSSPEEHPRVLPFTRRIDPDDVVAILEEAT